MTAYERPRAPMGPGPIAIESLRGPGASVLVLSGRIDRADIPALCERARALLRGCDGDPVVCDVGGLIEPDAATVEALARLQLVALRLGRRVRFRSACGDLRDLLVLVGLGEVLPCGPGSALEAGRQSEEREQSLGIEEEADPGEPAG
jgi:hypothetical protein